MNIYISRELLVGGFHYPRAQTMIHKIEGGRWERKHQREDEEKKISKLTTNKWWPRRRELIIILFFLHDPIAFSMATHISLRRVR